MPYRKHLSKDKVLRTLVKKHGPLEITPQKNIYLLLCASIISQQLSTKVAEVIYSRFIKLFNTKTPKASAILAMPNEKLRSIGLSNAKTQYVKNVCSFFIENKITDAKLQKMSNEEVVLLLTQIKGVGQWTAEMILMFALGKEDIFSSGDLGLQKAILQLYDLKFDTKKELLNHLESISATWSPYRTYACLHLWKHIDSGGI